jgi:small subunit ribosomal protein S3
VWIFKGEIMEHDPMASEKRNTDLQESGGGGRPRRDGDRDRGDRGDRGERRERRETPTPAPAAEGEGAEKA